MVVAVVVVIGAAVVVIGAAVVVVEAAVVVVEAAVVVVGAAVPPQAARATTARRTAECLIVLMVSSLLCTVTGATRLPGVSRQAERQFTLIPCGVQDEHRYQAVQAGAGSSEVGRHDSGVIPLRNRQWIPSTSVQTTARFRLPPGTDNPAGGLNRPSG